LGLGWEFVGKVGVNMGSMVLGARRLSMTVACGAITSLVFAYCIQVRATEPFAVNAVVHDLTPLHDATRVLVNPHKGKFGWAIIDRIIEKWTARGLGIAFRITCKETSTFSGSGDRFTVPSPDCFADAYHLAPTVLELEQYGKVKALGNWETSPDSAPSQSAECPKSNFQCKRLI